MTQALFRATRIIPIREQQPDTYICRRCGIQRNTNLTRGVTTHCRDCRPYKEEASA